MVTYLAKPPSPRRPDPSHPMMQGLMAYYVFNTADTNYNDYSPNRFNLTAGTGISKKSGPWGWRVAGDGTSGGVLDGSANISTSNPFTVFLSCHIDVIQSGYIGIVEWSDSTGGRAGLSLFGPSPFTCRLIYNKINAVLTNASFSDISINYSIVGMYDGTNTYIWVNSVPQSLGAPTNSTVAPTYDNHINIFKYTFSGALPFMGSVDYIAIYNKALSVEEITLFLVDPYEPIRPRKSIFHTMGWPSLYTGSSLISKHPNIAATANSIAPVYTGTSTLAKNKVIGITANSSVPIYSGVSNLSKNKFLNFAATSNVPIYQGTGIFSASYQLTSMANVIVPIYTGSSFLFKQGELQVGGDVQVPIYTGYLSISRNVELGEQGVFQAPVFLGGAALVTQPQSLGAFAIFTVPVYLGSSDLTAPHPLLLADDETSTPPSYLGALTISINKAQLYAAGIKGVDYTGQSPLTISNIQLIGATGTYTLPAYMGEAQLTVIPVLVSAGVNKLLGYIYKDTLYITTQHVEQL